MIDFHTHVLPGIDDGSRDIAMTERMLEMEMEQGITRVIATPHFYAHRRSVDSFLERRSAAYEEVQKLLDKYSKMIDEVLAQKEKEIMTV
jgi:protein-tyrosine phosphatase